MYKVSLFMAEDMCKGIHEIEREALPEGGVMTKCDYP